MLTVRSLFDSDVERLYPSRSVFTFSAPTLGNVTNSPHAKSLAPVIRPLVRLNHSIRRIDLAKKTVETLAGTYERGRRVREGATVALAGPPNAGKSSLFNRLLEEDRAIVTPVEGTTRDVLEETLDLGGVPVILLDTAGLHAPRDEADAEAVRRARGALESADRVLLVLDWSRPLSEEENGLLDAVADGRCLVILNKIDLACGLGLDTVLRLKQRRGALEVSAKTGQGIEALLLQPGSHYLVVVVLGDVVDAGLPSGPLPGQVGGHLPLARVPAQRSP